MWSLGASLARLPLVVSTSLRWAILFLPNLELRALHLEEGRHALAARDILDNRYWLAPEAMVNISRQMIEHQERLEEWNLHIPLP